MDVLSNFLKTFVFAIAAVVAFFSSCNSSDNSYNYYYRQCNSADSILDYYKSHHKTLGKSFLADVRYRFAVKQNEKEAEKIIEFIENARSKGKFNAEDEAYYNFGQGMYWLLNDPEKSYEFLNKVPVELVERSDTFSLMFNNVMGQYYFQINNIEKSLDFMQKAFSAAMELGDTIQMGRMATNLGGINSILGYEKAAVEYLLKAESYDPDNLILVNNLASVLTSQKQYSKAKELLDPYTDFLTNENPSLEQIIYRLTYVHLMQELEFWEEARTHLEKIDVSKLPQPQHYNYYSFELLQRAHDNSPDLEAYMTNILEKNGEEGYSELFYYLSGWSTRVDLSRINNHFKNNLSSLDTSVFDLMSKSVYFDIRSDIYKKNGLLIKAAEMESQSVKFLKEHYAAKLESKDMDLTNRLSLFELEKKYAKNKHKTEEINWRLRMNNLLLLFGFLFLAFMSFAYYRQRQLARHNESLSKDLFLQKQSELELLERERETSKKLVELSTRILETSKELKMKLVSLPEKNLPGIRESIEDLDYILFLNKSVDTTVIAKGYDFSKMEFLNDLIDSQRQVLSLSLDNYRPKEIAVTLNLSYSYVRNVQSRLRKKLKDEGYETFESLKKDLEA